MSEYPFTLLDRAIKKLTKFEGDMSKASKL